MGSAPPKGTSLRGTASFDFLRQSVRVLAVGDWKNPPPRKKRKNSRDKGCAKLRMRRNEPPLSDLYKILQGGRYPLLITRTVKGLLGGGGQISPFPIGFHRRPYNTLALPCECDNGHFLGQPRLPD